MAEKQTVTSQIELDGDDLRVRMTLRTETIGAVEDRDNRVQTTTFLTVAAMTRYRDELDRRIQQALNLGTC